MPECRVGFHRLLASRRLLRPQPNRPTTRRTQLARGNKIIAASARQHGLAVATRNITDYRHAGAPVVNPFEQ